MEALLSESSALSSSDSSNGPVVFCSNPVSDSKLICPVLLSISTVAISPSTIFARNRSYGISSISFPGKILGRSIKDTNAPNTSQGNQRDNPDRFGSSLDSISCESGSEDLLILTSYGLFSSFYLRK